MKKLIYLFMAVCLCSLVIAIDLTNDTRFIPSSSGITFANNKTVEGFTEIIVNETCVVFNSTIIFCNAETNVDWFTAFVSSITDLLLQVSRASTSWITVNCSATNANTYDLWIKDTIIGYTWWSISGLASCEYTFTSLWDHVTYNIYANASDGSNYANTSIEYYLKPYKSRIGVYVGP